MLLRWSLIVLWFVALVAAAEPREIQLKDGSVLTGSVRSFDGTTYVIESDSLGTVSINHANIQTIRAPQSSAQSLPANDLLGIQQQLMNNGEIMALIQALQHDPQIQAIVNDPQLLQAITAGDVQALMHNDKFKALLEHPKIQEISRKVVP